MEIKLALATVFLDKRILKELVLNKSVTSSHIHF